MARNEEAQAMDVEVLHSDAVESMERAQVDMQVATAKRYPRDVARAIKNVETLATQDAETAEACFYAIPRDGKVVSGPSIRLAEIVATSWGNMRAQVIIAGKDDREITARGMAWDLETNVAVSVETKRRIVGKSGKRYSDDMVVTTGNAASSIAFRNAVFKVVPTALLKETFNRIRQVAMGDERTLQERVKAMVAWFEGQGVSAKRLVKLVGKSDTTALTLEDVQTLRETATAIKDGATSIEEMFPDESAKKDPFEPGRHSVKRKPEPEAKPEPEPEPEPEAASSQRREDAIAEIKAFAASADEAQGAALVKAFKRFGVTEPEDATDEALDALLGTVRDLQAAE